MKKNKNGKRMLSLLLSLVMLLSLLPMQVMADTDRHGWEDDGREHDQIATAAEEGLPIYFFIAQPGTKPTPTSNSYSDYPGYAQGSAKATAAANSVTVDGIRNVEDESIVTQYIDQSTLRRNGQSVSLADFEQYGSISFGGTRYSDAEYDLVWLSISKKYGSGYKQPYSDPHNCYCDIKTGTPHIHIDAILSRKVALPDDLTLYKEISKAQNEDVTFTFRLEKLKQHPTTHAPLNEVDTTFRALDLSATIKAGETRAEITGVGMQSVIGAFGYYRVTENVDKKWAPNNALYISVATNGTIRYSTTLVENNFVESSKNAVIHNDYRTYTVTYDDGLADVVAFEKQVTTGELYGAPMPTFEGTTPVYPEGRMTFRGWQIGGRGPVYSNADILAMTVEQDTDFIAKWEDAMVNVTWVDSDGTVLDEEEVFIGSTPEYNGKSTAVLAAEKSDEEFTYIFAGWNPEVGPVTKDTVYRAQYTTETNSYTVTWKDSDGTVLETDTVKYGDFPSYDNAGGTTDELAKAKNTASATYAFSGWKALEGSDPVTAPVRKNAVYQADYSAETKTYTITWVNYDGKLLEEDEAVPYGETPEYNGETPEREDEGQYSYTFAGWTPTVSPVTGNKTYRAYFNETRVRYTGTVEVWLDKVGGSGSLEDITVLTKDAGATLSLKSDEGTFVLTRTGKGVYKSDELVPGTYQIVDKNGNAICKQSVVIKDADETVLMYYYSVTYELAGGSIGGKTADVVEYYHEGQQVRVSAYEDQIAREDYAFRGWWYNADGDNGVDEGELYHKGANLTGMDGILKPYTLIAQWDHMVTKVDVELTIYHHTTYKTGIDPNPGAPLNINLTYRPGNQDNYWEQGLTHTDSSWYDASKVETGAGGKEKTTKLKYSHEVTGFENLSDDWEYSANILLEHYQVIYITTEKRGDTYTVKAVLQYHPELFTLNYTVIADPSVPDALIPAAVDLKILSDALGQHWYPISGHALSSVDVHLDEKVNASDTANRKGTGSYDVPVGGWNNNRYHYRVAVVGFTLNDGVKTELSAEETALKLVRYDSKAHTATYELSYAGGAYYAMVEVEMPANDRAQGAYGKWSNSGVAQVGEIIVTVFANPQTVTLDANGGKFGSKDKISLKDLFQMPDIDDYVPTGPSASHIFGGYTWYEDKDKDGTLDENEKTSLSVHPKTAEALGKSFILVANWKAPFTVKGTVYADKNYHLGDNVYTLIERDLIKEVTVVLQQAKPGTTNYLDVRTLDVAISYGEDAHGEGSFTFDNVPDSGSWRIRMAEHNYAATYLNEPDSLDSVQDFGKYAVSDSEAVRGEDSIAVVNAHLEFKPDPFNLAFEVIATEIGAGFRPEAAEVLVLCDVGVETDPQKWPVITQMVSGSGYSGVDVSIGSSGSGQGSYPVWKNHASGENYVYAIRLDLTGDEPYTATYNGSASYHQSPAGLQQNRLLTATLIPKAYPINYYVEVGSSVKLTGVAPAKHIWSFETDLSTAIPTREGYVFTGWVDANEEPVTEIAAEVAAETNLYATWEVDNWKDADKTEDSDDKDSPIGGDGIPDSKQIHIRYTAGTGGSVAPIGEIVTLVDGKGEYSENLTVSGSGSQAKASVGYALDRWSNESAEENEGEVTMAVTAGKLVPTVKNAKGGEEYLFHAAFDTDIKGGSDGGSDGVPDKYQAFVRFVSQNTSRGTVTNDPAYVPVGDEPYGIYQTYTFVDGEDNYVDPAVTAQKIQPTLAGVKTAGRVDGGSTYIFDRWTRDEGDATVIPTDEITVNEGGVTILFVAHFVVDDWDAEDGEETGGDGIADYKQALIKYVATTNGRGEVSGKVAQIFNLTAQNDGSYSAVVDPDDDVTATGKDGFAFDFWGDSSNYHKGGADAAVTAEQAFGEHTLTGGQVVVYTAHFAEDNWKDADKTEDPDDKDDPTGGDGIPDARQILIQYTVNDEAMGTATPSADVITLSGSDVTSAAVAAEKDGYAFDRWYYTTRDSAVVEYNSNSRSITPTIKNAVGGSSYIFTAHFDVDVLNPDGNVPDKYEKTVTFQIENGTWASGSKEDIVVYVPLRDSDGYYAEDGSGALNVPTGMKADRGYGNGSWGENEPPATVSGMESETYVYTFKRLPSEGGISYQVILTKVDAADNRTTLADVVFELYKEDGTLVGKYTTNDSGRIEIERLPDGEYYWQETRPREGYRLETEKQEFELSGGRVYRKTVTNARSKVPSIFSDEHYAYIIGYSDGLIRPRQNITRAEVATIFFRLLNEETRAKYMTKENNFPDVPETMWCNTAVSTMAAMGIINGRKDGNFDPKGYITRAEFAAIASRFDESGITEGPVFTDTANHWAKEEIGIAASNGWILGYDDGSFRPNDKITRAAAIAMINRVLQRLPEYKEDLLKDMIVWKDNMDTSAWYYINIQEATNSHTYDRKANGYEYWVALQENRDWAALERN